MFLEHHVLLEQKIMQTQLYIVIFKLKKIHNLLLSLYHILDIHLKIISFNLKIHKIASYFWMKINYMFFWFMLLKRIFFFRTRENNVRL